MAKIDTSAAPEADWFGLKLKELREAAGLTQQGLADKAGMSKGGLADLEQGRYSPSWGVVLVLAKVLGVECTAFQKRPKASTKLSGKGRPAKE